MEEEEDFVGCISCMSTNDLVNLFAVHADTEETLAQTFETCYDLKVTNDFKYICMQCAERLELAAAFKNQTVQSMAMLQSIKDEEYLDETILAEAEGATQSGAHNGDDADDDAYPIEALDETSCIYCDLQLSTAEETEHHIRLVHGLEPRTGRRVTECSLCGAYPKDLADHLNRCHDGDESAPRQFACHFCENVYASRKACFTHLRMKHGLKLCNDHTPKYTARERKKCHVCGRDFSQKQILNNHLLKAHGVQVEKRKAFACPLCPERVSYGAALSAHLLRRHCVRERVRHLQFRTMDDFMAFKSAVQEETKYRFRKTTASKQTIEGVRSHYMCSQSGTYVYQGKGVRCAPERQIYKSGRACPAHMVVTEAAGRVRLVFHATHVGHPPCPYYEPREPKGVKSAGVSVGVSVGSTEAPGGTPTLVCDACGAGFADTDRFKAHVASHGLQLYPCRHCSDLFQNVDAWERHSRLEHDMAAVQT